METYVKSARHGKFILLRGDMISEFINLYGEWCEAEIELFSKVVPRDGIVIEIGSHIGSHSIPISRICNEGMLYCFEPQRIIQQIHCGNVALNNRKNITSYPYGISDIDEFVRLPECDYSIPWNYGAYSIIDGYSKESTFKGEVRTEEIQLVTLENFVTRKSLSRLNLLKIDAEGAELKILDSSENLIKRLMPFIFIENNSKKTFNLMVEKLNRLGYKCYWFCSSRFRTSNFYGSTWKIDGFDVNMFCQPSEIQLVHDLQPVVDHDDLFTGRIPVY
jgi:FkbM family methyltransferase